MPDEKRTKTTTLLFESLEVLWDFAQTLIHHLIQINKEKRTLTCNCSDDEVKRAVTSFRAEVVREEGPR